MTNEKSEKRFWRFGNPILWGLGLSLGLLVLVACLGSQTGKSGQSNFREFLELTPNEMGDTLAGVFASLAFIWIVVTVFLQSHELREQRKELSLTRDELKLARQAQQEQLQVMQKQADIFDDEKTRRDEAAAKQLLDARLETLERDFKSAELSTHGWKFLRDGTENLLPILNDGVIKTLRGMSGHELFLRVKNELDISYGILEFIVRRRELQGDDIKIMIDSMIEKCRSVLETESLSKAHRIQVDDFMINGIIEVLTSMIDTTDKTLSPP